MMRRDIKKSFWVNSEEDRDIKAKSQAAGLTEAEFLRQRVKGYHPVVMSNADMIAIMAEAMRWRAFQNSIEQEILIPKRGD